MTAMMPLQPSARSLLPPPTAFGMPLEQDERVVFAHVPPPVSGGERAVIVLIGCFFLPIVVGIFIIIYAFMKKSDRVWLITNRRVVNVNAKGVAKSIKLQDIVLGVVSRASESIDLRYGVDTVAVPTKATVNGIPMLTAVRTPRMFADMPGISVPP